MSAMIAEYVFKQGFNLHRFFARFTESTDFGKKDGVHVNGQYIHAIAQSVDDAKAMIDAYYAMSGIKCEEIELVQPVTTTNDDLKRLLNPTQVLGYDLGVYAKTASAKKVLQLMDSEEDGDCRYQEFVRQVSIEDCIPYEQLEAELEPFI